MTFSITLILIIATGLISFQALNNKEIQHKLIYSPYIVKHDGQWYRIFSHMLIHADFGHLAFNMLSLYFLGEFLEQSLILQYGFQLGIIHFLIIYIIGGAVASIYPYFKHQNNPSYQALGASGAVSAVIFACILWNPWMEVYFFLIPIPIPAVFFGPAYLLIEYLLHKRGGTGIAHDAHIGGAIFGVIYVLFINIDKGKEFIQTIFNYF